MSVQGHVRIVMTIDFTFKDRKYEKKVLLHILYNVHLLCFKIWLTIHKHVLI